MTHFLTDVSRQLSMSVRRQSLDSQMSHQLAAEQHWLAAQRAIARHQRRKTRRERERLLGPHQQSPYPIQMRRGSDSSLQSLAASLRRVRPRISASSKAVSVARATSTGDLNPGSVIPQNYLSLLRPLVGQQKRNQVLINPPFTHGMTDASTTRMSTLRGTGSEATPSTSANNATTVGGTPNNATMAGNQSTQNRMAMIPPYTAMANPYASYLGYLGGLQMPSHPGEGLPFGYPPFYPGYPFYPPGIFPFGQGFTSYPELDPRRTPLLPQYPLPDSTSESGFIPIITSDSEFTDTGIATPYLLSARLAVEERERVVAELAAMSLSRPQTNQETQTERGSKAPTPILKAAPSKTPPTEAIEMRELKSGQSHRSNVSATSKARLSKSPQGRQVSRASKSNTPLHRYSSVSPPSHSPAVLVSPAHQQQAAVQVQGTSPRRHDSYQAVPVVNLNSASNGHQWDHLNDHQCQPQGTMPEVPHCSCQCSTFSQEYSNQSPAHLYGHTSGYQQGALSPEHYRHTCPGQASGSTEPNTIESLSCPSNSDGPHSCHTYLFAPVPSTMEAELMSVQGFAANGFAQSPEQYQATQDVVTQQGVVGTFSDCCDGPPHQQPLGVQGLNEAGFVSR